MIVRKTVLACKGLIRHGCITTGAATSKTLCRQELVRLLSGLCAQPGDLIWLAIALLLEEEVWGSWHTDKKERVWWILSSLPCDVCSLMSTTYPNLMPLLLLISHRLASKLEGSGKLVKSTSSLLIWLAGWASVTSSLHTSRYLCAIAHLLYMLRWKVRVWRLGWRMVM